MAFVNEVVSDADIDKYGLPFPKGGGRYWTRDAERDLYLWGGKGGNPAFGEEILGKFVLSVKGKKYKLVIRPGRGSMSFSEVPYVVVWDKIISIVPADSHGISYDSLLQLLKEALGVYGQDGEENQFVPQREVIFHF